MHHPPQLRPWLEGLAGYTPGHRASRPSGRLASNESPVPPPWLPEEGTADVLAGLNRYPDSDARALREALALHHGIESDEVVVGNGSDELIMLLVQAYAAYTGSIVTASPGYGLYGLCARRLGARVHAVDLVQWRHDLAAMAKVEANIAFVCNPANPTGTIVDADALATFVRDSAARLIVIDEAYIEFSTAPSFDSIAAAVADPRVVVLRTFSKAYALAGIRVGYLVAHRSIARVIAGLKLPFSVNAIAQRLALQALQDRLNQLDIIAGLVDVRARMKDMLRGFGFDVVPSQANFVLVLLSGAAESDRLVSYLASHGIAVRPGRDVGIERGVRITVPTPEALGDLEQSLNQYAGMEASR